MKKVRFESPVKRQIFTMNDAECHSPRPFIEQELRAAPPDLPHAFPRVLPYNQDPIQRYEASNSSPYPMVHKLHVTSFPDKEIRWQPSDDLNLSLLDASNHEPRQPAFCRSILKETDQNKLHVNLPTNLSENRQKASALSSIENNKMNVPPNVLVKDNSFFIRRDNLDKYQFNINPVQSQFNKLSFGKENDPLGKKADIIKTNTHNLPSNSEIYLQPMTGTPTINDECICHHCAKKVGCTIQPLVNRDREVHYQAREQYGRNCVCSTPRTEICSHCDHIPPRVQQNVCKSCNCRKPETSSPQRQNAVEKKTWAIEKYEQSKHSECKEVEKQTNVSKEKREPTVADLFKIIKLQNEQLQLLQEKVDKFMTFTRPNVQPTITCSTEHVAMNTVENDQHKMSIGVMTSFEMIRTSTVINKELVTQTNENAQIQCNRSQISIKEVVSKPANVNFLDGIVPKNVPQTKSQNEHNVENNRQQAENVCEEKTLNELSLYNVQVDTTTPLISPDQTLYLDVRDYSDSEASSNDQSNVGWTYYNKVMTHVNGMLQNSEMPSSASAMYRNMRQQCVQMHIDKTNVSVTKRVKFGDDPLGLHQPHIFNAPATETSLKMNQLAAKYLKNMPAQAVQRPMPNSTAAPIDMSFATRNYMEKHRLLQGLPASTKSPQPGEIPRFLDITALKQQPKFL